MTHTWNLYLAYHACPKCGRIIESRKGFIKTESKFVKNLVCPNCDHPFTIEQPNKTSPNPEFDWS